MGKFSEQVIDRIRSHYTGGDLAPGDLLDLLQFRVLPAAERASQVLVRKMCAHPHANHAAHAAGAGNAMVLYKVTVEGHEYRVQLDGRNFVSDVMDPANVDLACSEPTAATLSLVTLPPAAPTGRARAASRASRR